MKISENPGVMYRQNSPNMLGSQQACTEKFKICSDGPSGRQKFQICSDQPIRPPKTAILFGSASKNCYFAPCLDHHLGSPPIIGGPVLYCSIGLSWSQLYIIIGFSEFTSTVA